MRLDALTLADCERVREWRNAHPAGLRTPYLLTERMQRTFYERVISDRAAPHRYWAVRQGGELVAMVGLTDIAWENGHAEISLVVQPHAQQRGVGKESVRLVLQQAFDHMRLLTVFGECYANNATGLAFWQRMLHAYGAADAFVELPRRKYRDGKLHGSVVFWFAAETWKRGGEGPWPEPYLAGVKGAA